MKLLLSKWAYFVVYVLIVLLVPDRARANFGTALSFNGSSAYVTVPVINLSGSNTLALEAWIKPTNLTATGASEIIRQEVLYGNPDWLLSFQNNGTILSFGVHTAANYQELRVSINAADYVDGNWHHIAATYDGTTKILYKDGVPIGSDSQSGNVVFQAILSGIGVDLNNGGTNEFFNGAMDEVSVWAVTRSAADIAASLHQPLTGAESGLAACWHFDEGSGTSASDSGPNALTGTLVNNPVWIISGVPGGSSPAVVTKAASNLNTNSAMLNGIINPIGFSTSFYFDYGTTTNYGSQTTPVDIGNGSIAVPVSAAVTSLNPGIAYHYRVVATVKGSPTYGRDTLFVTGGLIGGSALNFTGSNAYVVLPAIDLSAGNQVSLEAWIKPNDITTPVYSDIVRQQGSSATPDWLLGFQNNGALLTFGLKTASGYQEFHLPIQPGDYTDGKWHHIAATYDGAIKRLYRDGLQIGAVAQTGNVTFTAGGSGAIGAAVTGTSEFFTGTIDEVRIWSVARSATDIAGNIFTTVVPQPGLAAYYRFDEGSGTTASDFSGNARTGSLVNSPAWVSSTVPFFVDPPITIGLISQVTANSAVPNITVNPMGVAGQAFLVFGATTNYDHQTALQNLGNGSIPISLTNALLRNLAPAQQYHYRVVVTNINEVFFSPDKVFFTLGNNSGTALNFNGINSYVTVPPINLSASNALTLEAWIKPTDLTTTAYSDLIRQQGASYYPDWLLLFQNNGTFLSFGVNAGGTYNELRVPINAADYVDGNWHHIAATYDGTTKILYKDGVPIGSNSQSGNILFSGAPCSLGAFSSYSPSEFFNGLMDEVQVWNVARSAAQVSQLLNHGLTGSENGLSAYFRFDEGSGVTTSDLSDSGHNGTLVNSPGWVPSTAPVLPAESAVTGFVSGATTNSATLNGSANPGGLTAAAYFNYGFTTNYTASTPSQNIGNGFSPVPMASPISALLAGQLYHYRLSASNSGSTVLGRDGTFFTAGPFAGKALSFNGSNSYVRLPVLDLSSSNAITLEAWIKSSDITSAATSDILRQQAFATTDWFLGFENHGTILSFGLGAGSPFGFGVGGAYQELQIGINSADFADGNWHHIAATYDGTTQRLYRDGALIGSVALTGNVTFTANDNSIGASFNGVSGSEFFNGLIDEVRIWAVPRSAADINQYLNRSLTGTDSGLLAYWRFDEGTGIFANDATGNGHTGILINGPVWVNSATPLLVLQPVIVGFVPYIGRQGTSVSLSGTDLLSVTGVMFNGVSASFTTNSNFSLTAIVPIGATTGPITLITPFNNAASTNTFLIDNVPPAIAFSTPQNATIVTSLPTVKALASDNLDGSGLNAVFFYIQRESDLEFWTGLNWGAPTALATTLANGQWSRNSGLPNGASLTSGSYTIYAVAADNVGNSSIIDVGVTVNTTGLIAPITRLSNHHMQLRFAGIPGKTYRIQSSTNLSTWVDLGTLIEDASGLLQYEDTNAPSFPTRFYRTVTP